MARKKAKSKRPALSLVPSEPMPRLLSPEQEKELKELIRQINSCGRQKKKFEDEDPDFPPAA